MLTTEPRWDFAFVGVLAYLIIEYTRLPLMFPVLQSIDPAKIAVAVGALGWMISPRLVRNSVSTRKIDFCVAAFLLASILSAFFADYSGPAWNQVIDVLKWGVVYFLVSRAVISGWRSKVFVVIFLILNLKLAQFAIRAYLSIGTVEVGGHEVAMVGLGSSDFFGNSNDFGTGMCVVLPLAASLFLGESKTLSRIFYFVSFMGIFAAMLLSGCRGALVATCFAVIVAIVRSERKMVAILTGLLVVVGTLVLLPGGNLDRLRSAIHPENDTEASLRLGFWRAGAEMFKDHPILGVGPGNFASSYRDHYFGSDPHPRAWAPHSIYIQGFAELGIVGAIPLFILFWLSLLLNARTRKLLRESGADSRDFRMRLALGLELCLVAYLVSGAFLTTLYYPHLWFLLGMSVGLQTACQKLPVVRGAAQFQEMTKDAALATP